MLGGLWCSGSPSPELSSMGQLEHLKWLSLMTAWICSVFSSEVFWMRVSAQGMLILCPSINLGIHGENVIHDSIREWEKKRKTKQNRDPWCHWSLKGIVSKDGCQQSLLFLFMPAASPIKKGNLFPSPWNIGLTLGLALANRTWQKWCSANSRLWP